MNIDPDLNDDLSSAMGTETLLAHDLVPEGLPASSKGPAEQQIHHIGGVRYLAVDQTANQRQGSKVSKIWLYGAELRALDSPFSISSGSAISAYLLHKHTKSLAQMAVAFDIFACPATSCECERAFSSANKLITPERNSIGDNLIEALECLKAWWNNGLIKRP